MAAATPTRCICGGYSVRSNHWAGAPIGWFDPGGKPASSHGAREKMPFSAFSGEIWEVWKQTFLHNIMSCAYKSIKEPRSAPSCKKAVGIGRASKVMGRCVSTKILYWLWCWFPQPPTWNWDYSVDMSHRDQHWKGARMWWRTRGAGGGVCASTIVCVLRTGILARS